MRPGQKINSAVTAIVWVLAILVWAPSAGATGISQIKFYQMDFYGDCNQYGNCYPDVVDSNWGDFEMVLYPDSDPCNYYLSLAVKRSGYGSHWAILDMPLPNSAAPLDLDVSQPGAFSARIETV